MEDIKRKNMERAFSELESTFDCGCGDFLLLRSFVRLGYSNEPIIREIINEF